MVATIDIGRTAAQLLRDTWSGVRLVELEGPRRYCARDIGIAFAAALGRDVRMDPIPRDAWVASFARRA
jgi:NAD(P)H dehydrogenase (quinone)